MKARWMLIAMVLWAGRATGQELDFVSTASLSYDSPGLQETAGASTAENMEAGTTLELTGPLVTPMKSRSLWALPGNLLKLINPLAPTAPKVEYRSRGPLSPHGWATLVGWSPGRSAFPDPLTHEPSLTLISVKGQ